MTTSVNEEKVYFEKNVLHENEEEIEKFYSNFSYKGMLGKGGFGFVIAARYLKKNGALVAVKVINKTNKNGESTGEVAYFRRESKMLRSLRHENVLKIVDVIFSLKIRSVLRRNITYFWCWS